MPGRVPVALELDTQATVVPDGRQVLLSAAGRLFVDGTQEAGLVRSYRLEGGRVVVTMLDGSDYLVPAGRPWQHLGSDVVSTAVAGGSVLIGRVAGMHKLELNQCQIPSEGFEAIAGLKNLAHLYLAGTNVGDAHLRKLPPLTAVTDLALRDCPVGDEGLAGLEKWGALTTLILDRTEVKGDGLKHLANCPKLKTLNLDRNPVTSEGLIALAESRTISDLWIEGTPMTDAAASALAGMEKLDRIHAVGCNVTDAQCKALSLSHSLTKVGVSGPQITDKAAEHFTRNPRVVQLSFLNSGLTDWSYPVLKGMKQLTWLNVTGSRITPTGVGALRKALPKCQVLPAGPDPVHITAGDRKALQWALDQGAEVGLAHFNDYGRGLTFKKSVDEIDAYEWADWLVPHHINFHRRPVLNAKSVENLRGLTSLCNLGADGSPQGDAWLAKLAELPLAGTLVSLSVNGTGLTDAGAKHLTAFPKLHGVYLTGNRLSGDGAAHLRKLPQLRFVLWGETLTDDALKALKGLPLSELHINGNPELADAGVAHLAGLAELGRLTLGSPKVTDAGLARVLPSLTALTTLWVRHEGLGPGTLAAVGECKSLAGLELAGWPLDGDKLTALRLSPTVTRLSLLDVPGEVSDATLAHLATQKQLKALLLPAVKLGEERVVKLSKALSDTVVATADGEFANGMKK
ncbi:Putative regulatory subunit (Fragment) OS=Gemmata sp. Wa1-1 PE=4 SV=1: LRR_6 [Gemmataceae bacterium]